MKALVLIETEIGKSTAVAQKLLDASKNGHVGVIVSVDQVTGPYDVITTIELENLGLIGSLVTEEIQKIPGVHRTITCLAVSLP